MYMYNKLSLVKAVVLVAFYIIYLQDCLFNEQREMQVGFLPSC